MTALSCQNFIKLYCALFCKQNLKIYFYIVQYRQLILKNMYVILLTPLFSLKHAKVATMTTKA